MTRNEYRLLMALMASLLLHALPFVRALLPPPAQPPVPPPLTATLRPPPSVEPPPPPLKLDEQPVPEKQEAPKKTPKPMLRDKPAPTAKTWTQAVAQHLKKLNERGLFYPQEAIDKGIEGEVLVLIIIDESGRVTAARVEQSSGYRVLDDAALRAVRSLHSLPSDAPREALLPVRFRLR